MRHYEIVLLIHQDQSEQVSKILENYTKLITDNHGIVHRAEDSGKKPLAYPIKKMNRAHFAILNIEINDATLIELKNSFKFSDTIIRTLITTTDEAITTESVLKNPALTKKLSAEDNWQPTIFEVQ